ncbi:MFS transporter, partial [Klebsiella pneumoniae]
GLRRSMLAGLLLMAGASALGAIATGFAPLLALRAVEGLGFLLVAMPGPGLIRRCVAPHDLSARMGWWGTYMPLGSAIGLLLGPW